MGGGWYVGSWGRRGQVGGGGQGGCERRIEFFVKIQKKSGGVVCRVVGEERSGWGSGWM